MINFTDLCEHTLGENAPDLTELITACGDEALEFLSLRNQFWNAAEEIMDGRHVSYRRRAALYDAVRKDLRQTFADMGREAEWNVCLRAFQQEWCGRLDNERGAFNLEFL